MKLPFDKIKIISLTFPQEDAHLLLTKKIGDLFVSESCNKNILYKILKTKKAICYLDQFVILLPEETKEHSKLWLEFYKIFGNQYEQIIDIRRNINSIQEILSYISSSIELQTDSKILDYGCGSGLAVYTECNASLVGYEPVLAMKKQASQRGYNVIGFNEFRKLPESYFNAGFANYVFHMIVNERDIYEITKKMKRGAIFIANFYKGINVERVNNMFSKYGYTIRQLSLNKERKGEVIYEYKKR